MDMFSINISIIGSRSGALKQADLYHTAKDAPEDETKEESNDMSLIPLKNDSWLMEARLGIIMFMHSEQHQSNNELRARTSRSFPPIVH